MNQDLIRNVFTVVFTVFGSLIGSFSNVVILRMASGTSVVFPPSACPACNHRLSAIDLVPILSWLQLAGKCRYCKAKISYQYPLVETVIAGIVGFSFYRFGFSLNFILLSSGSVIWFIASVLFLRNEVNKPQPFIWASLYLAIFSYALCKSPLPEIQTLLVSISIAVVLAALGSKNQSNRYYSWGTLAFISTLRCLFLMPYVLFLPIVTAIAKYFKSDSFIPDKIYFLTQVVLIFVSLALV